MNAGIGQKRKASRGSLLLLIVLSLAGVWLLGGTQIAATTPTAGQPAAPLRDAQALTWQEVHSSPGVYWYTLDFPTSSVGYAIGGPSWNVNNGIGAATIAKTEANRVMHTMANEGIQLHGGIGMTDEYDVGFYLKRARVLEQSFGSSSWLKDRFSKLSGY